MINIGDLHMNRDILPLFDYTYNDYSRDKIVALFKAPLSSVDEILHRQEIIRGMLKNWKILESFSYAKADLTEVYQFCGKVESLPQHSWSLPLQLRLYGEMKLQIQTRLIQFIHLMHRLYNRYFSLLQMSAFPVDFRKKAEYILQILSCFDLHKHEEMTREGNFAIRHMIAFIKTLQQELTPDKNHTFWDNLFEFEAYVSVATGMHKHNFAFPVIDATRKFVLKGFYHPMLKEPVKNDLITENNVLLITGPNMSGKSTLLKSVGICVYLAHIGVGVPAESCILPFFDSISVAIDLKDDLKKGYSHFKMEVTTLKNVVLAAGSGKKCFAIFDELFRGTNPEDALEISTTTIAGLSKFPSSLFLVSTHLYQLKTTLKAHETAMGIHGMQCSLDGGRPEFTYTLEDGWSDLRIGRIIFEQEGLNGLLTQGC